MIGPLFDIGHQLKKAPRYLYASQGKCPTLIGLILHPFTHSNRMQRGAARTTQAATK
jgi:hypothetical protein